jgi:Arc/MetJ family transcription regulator
MKKTLEIDNALLAQAKSAINATTDTATIRAGLEALIRHAAYQQLAALRGSEPDALETLPPRRREPAAPRRRLPTKGKRSAA